MKKILSAAFALVMILSLASCSGGKKGEGYSQIVASYSIKNYDNDDEDFIVEVQDLGGVYTELFDEKGLYLKLASDAKILDAEGNEIKREDINYGDMLQLTYEDGLVKNNPKTIKVHEVKKIG